MSKIISLLVIALAILISYQNCAIYQSDDIKDFEKLLEGRLSNGCLPYLDINIASDILQVSPDNLTLSAAVNSGGNFSCSIFNKSDISNLRSTIVCSILGDQEFSNFAQDVESYNGLYNSYCPNPANFSCEHLPVVVDTPRAQLASSLGFQTQEASFFLSYFKLADNPAIRGYGFASYLSNGNVVVTVKEANSSIGVSCSLIFDGQVENLLDNNQRQTDWNGIRNNQDIETLKAFTSAIVGF